MSWLRKNSIEKFLVRASSSPFGLAALVVLVGEAAVCTLIRPDDDASIRLIALSLPLLTSTFVVLAAKQK